MYLGGMYRQLHLEVSYNRASYIVLPTQNNLPVDIMATSELALMTKISLLVRMAHMGVEIKTCNTKFLLHVGNLSIFEEQNHIDRP